MHILKIFFLLCAIEILVGCSIEKHYYPLNYYKRQAKIRHINAAKIPDFAFKGYIKTFVRQQVIDGGPIWEESGYKFKTLDSQNTMTEFLMPFLLGNEFSIDTLQFIFKLKNDKSEMALKTSSRFEPECGNLEYKSSQVFDIDGTKYEIFKFCFKTLPAQDWIIKRDYYGTVFYSDKFGVISSTNCYRGFYLELPSKNNGRILSKLKRAISKDMKFRNSCFNKIEN